MTYLRLAFTPRYITLALSIALVIVSLGLLPLTGWMVLPALLGAGLTALGLHDMHQTRHSILRNYPISGHMRFVLENVREEIRQYFFESDTEGVPFSRNKRAIVYQRAKGQLDKRAFGTQMDVYAPSFEWLSHSIAPLEPSQTPFRVRIGGPECTQPYSASLLNVSAMSFGALSGNAIRALNIAAREGHFAHDTGEGSISIHHRQGGDLIWQIASGYFGCRNEDSSFSPELFAQQAVDPTVKMIEVKLSQGAKPGHGGVLPGAKVTAEIAAARGVPLGQDCISPPKHSAFSTPLELLAFVQQLRTLSGGKPVGLKLCIGQPHEFLAICKAMLATNITPDFIVIDGTEGGTGAAPLEFVDHIGMPLRDGLMFVHNALVGIGLRDRVKLGASGKVTSAFDMARLIALGADWCNAARGFMFSIGCIQAKHCHNGECPSGVATQDPVRQRSLVVEDKSVRAARFHAETIKALAEVIAAAGLAEPHQLRPHHVTKRIDQSTTQTYAQMYRFLGNGELLRGTDDPRFQGAWEQAQAESFAARG